MTLPRLAVALALLTLTLIATTSLVATGYVLGVRHSTADEIARVDEIHQVRAVCTEVLRMAERAARETLVAQETHRVTVAAWIEAMRQSGYEVDR